MSQKSHDKIRSTFFFYTVLILLSFNSFFMRPVASFATSEESRAWLGLFGKKPLSETQSFWHEAQFRYDLGRSTMQQLLARAGFLQTIGSSHEVGWILGYIQSGIIQEPWFLTGFHGRRGPLSWFGMSPFSISPARNGRETACSRETDFSWAFVSTD